MNSLGKKVVKNLLVVVGSISGLAAISTAFMYLFKLGKYGRRKL